MGISSGETHKATESLTVGIRKMGISMYVGDLGFPKQRRYGREQTETWSSQNERSTGTIFVAES